MLDVKKFITDTVSDRGIKIDDMSHSCAVWFVIMITITQKNKQTKRLSLTESILVKKLRGKRQQCFGTPCTVLILDHQLFLTVARHRLGGGTGACVFFFFFFFFFFFNFRSLVYL